MAQITKELPLLRRLGLRCAISKHRVVHSTQYSRNRLQIPSPENSALAFEQLIELHLNDTLLSWVELRVIMMSTPRLQTVEFGYNHLTRLSDQQSVIDVPPFSVLQTINLDSNLLSDWEHVSSVLIEFGR